MKKIILRVFFLMLCILFLLIFTNSVSAIEKIDCFTFTNDITIDGKWTNIDEWNDSSEEIFSFVNGSGEAYLRIIHDVEYLYVLVDFITYNDVKTGDGCVLILDTKKDGGSSVKSDDLAIAIRWNSPSDIFTGIQWTGWWNNWENLPEDFDLDSSIDGENSPYSSNSHLIFEFKIAKNSFKSSKSTIGFLVFLSCDNENLTAVYPTFQNPYKPDDWADLIFFDDTIQLYHNVQNNISEAYTAIANAKSEGRTDGLKQAETLLELAETSQRDHNYNDALNLSNQAIDTAKIATISSKSTDDTPGFSFLILIVSLSLIFLRKRR